MQAQKECLMFPFVREEIILFDVPPVPWGISYDFKLSFYITFLIRRGYSSHQVLMVTNFFLDYDSDHVFSYSDYKQLITVLRVAVGLDLAHRLN